jgi:hypothetical protein
LGDLRAAAGKVGAILSRAESAICVVSPDAVSSSSSPTEVISEKFM